MKFSQSRKKSTFCKGVSPWFLEKFDLLLICKKETFFDRKECFFDVKSEVLKNSRKSTFWKGVSPWFLSKNWPFSWSCFLSKERQKERFFDILDRKECFLDHKKKVLKTLKNRHFAKGLVHGFCQKIDLFLIFFWPKKARKKHFLIFWIEKNAF